MKKKKYVKATMKVISVQCEGHLLSGSNSGSGVVGSRANLNGMGSDINL